MAKLDYDLVIIGAGSGNMLPAGQFDGWRIAMVEGSRFGGTCLNRGCIPSKMLVHTADVAQVVRRAGRFGIGAELTGVDWPAIRDRVFSRIEIEMPRNIAELQRACRDHLGVKACARSDQAQKVPTVAVGPVHHRRHA